MAMTNDVLITHLGHAGLMIENNEILIICDPWIVPGSFDDSWFQYPRNEHMNDVILSKLEDKSKDKYIFVSHEHKDHYDPRFLNSLPNRDFTIIIANFRRTFLLDWFKEYECKNIICLNDTQEYIINDNVKFILCVEDCEMNRDCGFLLKMNQYVIYNGNDCKYPYYDKLSVYGDIDVFAQQFSGATWHPISYDYTKEEMDKITASKRNTKRQTLIKYIQNLNVKMFIPCAGPPVFLEKGLYNLCHEEFTIFPRANWIKDKFFEEFGDKLKCPIFMPGDIYSLNKNKMIYFNPINRVDDYNFQEYIQYIKKYQQDYKHIFEKREIENSKINDKEVFEELIVGIQEKLNMIKNCNLSIKLFDTYIELHNFNKRIKVDFHKKKLTVEDITDKNFEKFINGKENVYSLRVDGWQIKKVLTGELTWEEMMITFRPKLSRRPDKFSTLLTAFLFQQNEDLEVCFNVVLDRVNSSEKMIIETPKGELYEVCKKCPHQGQDLTISDIEDDRFLICPKHCWKFDLHNGGKSLTTDDTLAAVKITDPGNRKIYSLKSNEFEFIDFILTKKELSKSIINKPICKLTILKKNNTDILQLSDDDHLILKINDISRPYTFLKENNKLILYIKLYPNGKMSNEIKNIKKNSTIKIKKYNTEIEFDKINKFNNIVLFAGGTGITPFFRIIKTFINTKNITLIYSNTLKNEILLKNEIDSFKKLKTHYYNSDEHKNHIDKNYIQNLLNKEKFNDTLFLICGPPQYSISITNICNQLKISNIIQFDLVD